MNRNRLSRPSLKITRQADQDRATHFIVEVWNPFTSAYQLAGSVEDGLARVGKLANLIGSMWLQRHPKRDVLVDVPDRCCNRRKAVGGIPDQRDDFQKLRYAI